MSQVLTSLADADVSGIIADIGAQAGRRVAGNYVAEFDRLFVRLREYPLSGSPRKALGPEIRTSLVWPYVVLYEYVERDDVVTILRILHGRRKMPRRMLRIP